jgi:transposase-like protein
MVGHGAEFGRKKEQAIAALLTQRNIEEAAKAAGIGANTLLRWLKVPEFQTAYREARRARSHSPLRDFNRALRRQLPLC